MVSSIKSKAAQSSWESKVGEAYVVRGGFKD